MSRTTAAIKLLLVSLPLARSLPQLTPPYPIITTTSETVLATPTETLDVSPVPTDVLVDPVPTEFKPIPIDAGTGGGTWGDLSPPEATERVTIPLDPIYIDPIAPEWYPTPDNDDDSVSVEEFLTVVQPLLDIIQDLLPEDEVLVHSDAVELLPSPVPSIESPIIEPIFSETPEIVVPLPDLPSPPLPDLTPSSPLPTEEPATGPVFPDPPAQPFFPETSVKKAPIPGPVFPDAPSTQHHGANHDTPDPKDTPSHHMSKRDSNTWLSGIGDSIISALTGTIHAKKPAKDTPDELPKDRPVLSAFRHDVLQLPAEVNNPVGIAAIINDTIPQRNSSAPYSEAANLALINELLSLILQVLGVDFLPNDNGVNQTRQEIEIALREHKGPVARSDMFEIVNKVLKHELAHPYLRGSRRPPIKRGEGAATNDMMKLYSELHSQGEESVDSVTAFAYTLKAYFRTLDASRQTALLDSMHEETVSHELVKRQRGRGRGRVETDPRRQDWDGRKFITYYTAEFHYYFPVLNELNPTIAQGLSDILTDPNIPVSPYGSLGMDNLPDQLRQFVLDTYVFLQIIQEGSISTDDKLLILEGLFDGVQLPSTTAAPVLPEPELPIETSATSTDTSSSSVTVPLSTGVLDPRTTNPALLPIPTDTTVSTDAAAPTSTIVPPGPGTNTQPIGDFGIGTRQSAAQLMRRGLTQPRTMQRGLRGRQYDEGATLDDAPKLGAAALHAIAGPAGSLDPMGQYSAQTQASYATAKSGYRNSRPGYRNGYNNRYGSNAGYDSSAAAKAAQGYSPYEPDYDSPDYEPTYDSVPSLPGYEQYAPPKPISYGAPKYVSDAVADIYGPGYNGGSGVGKDNGYSPSNAGYNSGSVVYDNGDGYEDSYDDDAAVGYSPAPASSYVTSRKPRVTYGGPNIKPNRSVWYRREPRVHWERV